MIVYDVSRYVLIVNGLPSVKLFHGKIIYKLFCHYKKRSYLCMH